MVENKTFWYNPLGSDNNGNFGPDENSPGWVRISASSYKEAVTKLSALERAKVIKAFWDNDVPAGDWDEFWYATAGMGNGFTLACEEHGEMNEFDSLPMTFAVL